MSDIEKEVFRQKAIDLINEYRQQDGLSPIHFLPINTHEASAFIRSIQLHEKTKKELADCKQEFDDFRQEVSDAMEQVPTKDWDVHPILWRFIIPKPKPDPLVAALEGVTFDHYPLNDAKTIRAVLDKLGFEIREKNDD